MFRTNLIVIKTQAALVFSKCFQFGLRSPSMMIHAVSELLGHVAAVAIWIQATQLVHPHQSPSCLIKMCLIAGCKIGMVFFNSSGPAQQLLCLLVDKVHVKLCWVAVSCLRVLVFWHCSTAGHHHHKQIEFAEEMLNVNVRKRTTRNSVDENFHTLEWGLG